MGVFYDKWGNITSKEGWGGENPAYTASYTNNRRDGLQYDAAGNLTNDGGQNFVYDATGQQSSASYTGYLLQQDYDGDGRRVKKSENGTTRYYLRSSVLGGQVVAEMDTSGTWMRGYVYQGGILLAVQAGGVNWVHQDPVTKSQRITDNLGSVVSTVELDPWGGDTNRSSNAAFQPKKFTSYERDANGSDEAMFRRYNRWQSRFDQPDPYEGSYDYTDPQSFNRYGYVQNDPVNFTDPTGLCTFNINISGVSGSTLTDMQNEIARIFGTGGQSVVFGNPGQANGGSISISVVQQYPPQAALVIASQGSSPTDPAIYGFTLLNSGNAWVNSFNIFSQTNTGFSGYYASSATKYGRVAAHEAVQHGFLGRYDTSHLGDVTEAAEDSYLIKKNTDRFNMSLATKLALNRLCEPVTTTTPPLNNSPTIRPIRGGPPGGGIGHPPILGGGSNWNIFDLLHLLWRERVTVTVKPL
jgi:RHS repeat-associated protein